jgi:hypothetical protein
MLASKKSPTSLIPVRIGGLLIAANIVRPEQMALALAEARRNNLKVGDVLIAQRLVTDQDLHHALELQQLIKAGKLTVEMAAQALRQAREKDRNIHAALSDMGWKDENAIKTTDLAGILMEAGIVTRAQVDQAAWNSAKNMLPLGRNLVLAGAITPSLLGSALTALVLLRDRAIERNAAICALKRAHTYKAQFEECLDARVVSNHVRVGELLAAAGLLSESDSMIAVENGLLNQQSIGTVLLQSRMVTAVVLDAVLKLQKLIEDGSMQKVQAVELLRQVAAKQVGLDQFLDEMAYVKARALELLLQSGLVRDYETITPEMFRAAVRCVYAVDSGSHTQEQMIGALLSQFSQAHQAASQTA